MGMFSYFHIEGKPIKCRCGKELKDFQTKDLFNVLDHFYLSKRGIFKKEIYTFRKPKRTEQTQLFGSLYIPFAIKEHKGWSYPQIDDTIVIYEYCNDCNTWISVSLKFIKGKLKKMNVTKEKR